MSTPDSLQIDSNVASVDPPMLVAEEATLSPRLRYRVPFRHIEPIVLISDFLIILSMSLLSGIAYHRFLSDSIGSLEESLAVGILVSINFVALNSAQGNYRITGLINRGRQLRYVTFDWLCVCLSLVVVGFMLKVSGSFSRGSSLTFFAVGLASLLTSRFMLARSLKFALERGHFAEKRIIIVAERGQLASGHALAALRQCGYLPVKTIEITSAEIDAPGVAKSLQSKLNDIISMCHEDTIDHLFLLIKWTRRQFIDDLVQLLRVVAIPVNLVPDDTTSRFLSSRAVNIGTTWTVELQRAPLSAREQAVKRAFDFCFATLGIVILSPLMLITALLIKIDLRGPVFFRQKRNGFNNHKFSIYKFRTMRVLEDGKVIRQTTRNDPRVTRLGRWLRQTSIDELPQLFNVVLGQMSLVGPRPHAVAHNDEYQTQVAKYAFRHHMKPGITGWAQVNGYRGETQSVKMMEQRVEHDIWYINHWTLWLDLRTILKTMAMIHRHPMAY